MCLIFRIVEPILFHINERALYACIYALILRTIFVKRSKSVDSATITIHNTCACSAQNSVEINMCLSVRSNILGATHYVDIYGLTTQLQCIMQNRKQLLPAIKRVPTLCGSPKVSTQCWRCRPFLINSANGITSPS